MQPFLLISAIVVSYMCVVQGPCRIQNWMKQGSRHYILSRLRYRDSHSPDIDNKGGNFRDNIDKHYDNNDHLYDTSEKSRYNNGKLNENGEKFLENIHNDEKFRENSEKPNDNGEKYLENSDNGENFTENYDKLHDNGEKFRESSEKLHENNINIHDNIVKLYDNIDDVSKERDQHREFHGRYIEYLRESSCRTPSGGAGNCISLYDCQPLMVIINKSDKSRQDLELLRNSQCGYQGQTPKVCCPTENSCFTPDAQPGRCVNLYSCSHIASMLQLQPVPKDVVTYVQNSRCQGPDQYSVCCGPPRNDISPRPTNGACTPTAAPPDPRTKCCGVDSSSEDKIVGGTVTSVDQYPWMAMIEYVQGTATKLLCGGALISGRYVLTAGHCVAGPVLNVGTPRNVRLGEYDISNAVREPDCAIVPGGGQDCTPGVTTVAIERTIPHPEYNPNSNLRRNDIALIRLRTMAPYNDFIRPICLPTTDIAQSPPPNLMLYAAGWGAVNATFSKSNIKLHVDLPFVSQSDCQPSYSVPRRMVQLWSGQLCAGGEKDKDSCKGDSGGPLMYEDKLQKKWEVAGVVSFGPTPCGAEDIPGVYTKVFHYIPWIRSQIKP